LPDQVKFTFWHVCFFAWFCNMAMHVGMSDLSVLRYAKHSWYGVASGAVATLAGMFPAIAMKLLGFVAFYGMIVMPIGAVVFVDFWLLKEAGLRPHYAEASDIGWNWAAALAWFLTLGICTWPVLCGSMQIFFVSLPGWQQASILA